MNSRFTRRGFMGMSSAAMLGGLARTGQGEELAPAKKAPWPFYAFDNGLGGVPTPEAKCKLLKDLGYEGIEYHPGDLPRMLEQLDKHGLKLFSIYTTPSLEDPIPKWGDWIKLLKGRDTRIEMGITRKSVKPSDPAGDEKGLALVKAISDLCADTGPVVSIYPHTGFWTERVDDGVRMAKLSERKNVGTNFNLVHWQWVKQTRTVEEALKDALPHLFLVTFNGLKGPKTGQQQIRPLDDSDYDLQEFLALVKKTGYAGPVGLQCWSVKEPAEEHLKRSMAAWQKLVAGLG
ncbi:MAG: TIM barrel protein [Planctomycetota bacterium]|nr:TIM barrel protein [Planctomycetota bacterium]